MNTPRSPKMYFKVYQSDKSNVLPGYLYGFELTEEQKSYLHMASFCVITFVAPDREHREFIFDLKSKTINQMITFYSHPDDDMGDLVRSLQYIRDTIKMEEDSMIMRRFDMAISKCLGASHSIDLDLLSSMLD